MGDNIDKLLPAVEIEFGEPKQKHVLKFGLGAFAKIEKLTGKNMLNGEYFTNMSATSLAVLLWAGTAHEKEKGFATWEELADQVTMADMKTIPEKLQAAFNNAAVEEDQKKTSPQPEELTAA